MLKIEQKLSYEDWVPGGFGTTDAVIFNDNELIVVDLKYGKGVQVFAEDNPQLRLYALAAIANYDPIYGPFETVKMAVVQPRLNHISEAVMTVSELLEWAETVVKPAAKLAWNGQGEFNAGDHCKFCKVRHTCRKRAEQSLATVGDQQKGAELTNEELAAIYPQLAGIVKWANEIEAYMLGRALAGTTYQGLKIVEGRSVRKFADDEAVTQRFLSQGFKSSQFTNVKLIGITDAEKLVGGKKKFAELLGDLVIKPEGKPVLVPETDKRPALEQHEAAVNELLQSA